MANSSLYQTFENIGVYLKLDSSRKELKS